MSTFIYNDITKATVPLFPSFIVNNEHQSSKFFIDSGVPEKNLIDWSTQFVNDNSVFIDVGAHMGTYSINLAPHCKHVYSFEPQQFTYYQLCGNVALNGLFNVTCYNNAVSDEVCTKELNIISHDGGGSTLEVDTIGVRNEKIIKKQSVETVRIDDYNFSDVSFIKIDVEGHELEVIKGAINTIEKYNPVLLFECWNCDWYVDKKDLTINFVKSLGYSVTSVKNYPHMFIASKL